MPSPHLPALLFAVLGTLPLTAHAVLVESQLTSNASVQIHFYEPIGQSFTALDNQLQGFEFQFTAINAHLTSAPITLSILDGAGTAGPVLASSTFSLPTGFFGFAGASFAQALVTGHAYTAVLHTDTAYWGIRVQQAATYAGGQAYYHPLTGPNNFNWEDAAFRATFGHTAGPAPVPESAATLFLLSSGVAGLRLLRRRRQA